MSIKAKKRLIIVLAVLLVLIGGGILGVNLYADSLLNRMGKTQEFHQDDVGAQKDESNVENIVLLGIDSDDGENARSDVMKIFSLDFENRKIRITSLQRDNIVWQPMMERYEKLNHAYWRSGVQGTLSAINYNFDLNATKYVKFTFDSVEEIVDILGGVEVELNASEAGYLGLGGAGSYRLNGAKALSFSRMRSIDNDYERMQRQNRIINEIIEELKGKSLFELLDVVNKVLPFIETNISNNTIKGYMTKIVGFDFSNIEQYQFPKDGYDSQLTSLSLYGYSPQYVLKDFSGEVESMHHFIYGEDDPYTASEKILKIEADILKLAGY